MPDQLVRSANGVALKGLKDMGNGTHAEIVFLGGGDFANPLPTMEQAAMGYDPSTGRTPVEQANNGSVVLLSTVSQTAVVKAAPGFLHQITVSVPVAGTVGTHLAVYDNIAASGTGFIGFIPLPAAGAAPVSVTFDILFATGLCIAPVNLTIASGAVTPANQTQTLATAGIIVNTSFR